MDQKNADRGHPRQKIKRFARDNEFNTEHIEANTSSSQAPTQYQSFISHIFGKHQDQNQRSLNACFGNKEKLRDIDTIVEKNKRLQTKKRKIWKLKSIYRDAIKTLGYDPPSVLHADMDKQNIKTTRVKNKHHVIKKRIQILFIFVK